MIALLSGWLQRAILQAVLRDYASDFDRRDLFFSLRL